MVCLLGLNPASYTPSALHCPERIFPETNCYVDLWIELLHARGIAAESALAAACRVDFEGDQWTFFKPDPQDLRALHGIDVHEMQLYRPAVEHALEQLAAGRTMTIEVDSFYLPDTAATAYQREHVKSSIAIEAIDAAAQRLRYFHGLGYYELGGADFCGVFRLGRSFSDDVLPPYTEVVMFDAGPRLDGPELRQAAIESLQRSLGSKPKRNPWIAFGERLARDLPSISIGSDSDYHAFAFATVRQCGAAFETAMSFVQWLGLSSSHAVAAMEALCRQASGSKTLLFKLARRRPFDPAPMIQQLAADWDTAMYALENLAISAEGRAA